MARTETAPLTSGLKPSFAFWPKAGADKPVASITMTPAVPTEHRRLNFINNFVDRILQRNRALPLASRSPDLVHAEGGPTRPPGNSHHTAFSDRFFKEILRGHAGNVENMGSPKRGQGATLSPEVMNEFQV